MSTASESPAGSDLRAVLMPHLQQAGLLGLLEQARRLHALATAGLHFSDNPFDRERFEEIVAIALLQIERATGLAAEPLLAVLPLPHTGYPTPMLDVRGALIEDGRILLVQEASDGLWTLPGGYADVGVSPAENIVKEMQEEAGVHVVARALYQLRHKARGRYTPDVRDFYKIYFVCERIDATPPAIGPETSGVDFFDPDHLPPLSRGRVIEADIHAAFRFLDDPRRQALFD